MLDIDRASGLIDDLTVVLQCRPGWIPGRSNLPAIMPFCTLSPFYPILATNGPQWAPVGHITARRSGNVG